MHWFMGDHRSSSNIVPSTSSLSNIVANFQDLSTVLTIFGADTVERKVTDPRANDLERMSTTWSIFGIVGIVRAYTKIHSAERAGVDIYDLGGYTSEKTKYSLSACTIGSSTLPSRMSWQDDRKQLLSRVDAGMSRWKSPNIIAMGLFGIFTVSVRGPCVRFWVDRFWAS